MHHGRGRRLRHHKDIRVCVHPFKTFAHAGKYRHQVNFFPHITINFLAPRQHPAQDIITGTLYFILQRVVA